jgi:hypothetical protein
LKRTVFDKGLKEKKRKITFWTFKAQENNKNITNSRLLLESHENKPALAKSHNISLVDREGRRQMSSNVGVSLLKTMVLGDVVQIIATDDDSSLHLGGDHKTTNDSATNGDISSEGALLVNVVAINGFLGGLEAQTNVLVVANSAASLGLGNTSLPLADEDGGLLLESVFSLRKETSKQMEFQKRKGRQKVHSLHKKFKSKSKGTNLLSVNFSHACGLGEEREKEERGV